MDYLSKQEKCFLLIPWYCFVLVFGSASVAEWCRTLHVTPFGLALKVITFDFDQETVAAKVETPQQDWPGVYVKQRGEWVALAAEAVGYRQPSGWHLYRGGVDTLAVIEGEHSQTSVTLPVEVKVITAGNENPSDFVLVRLRNSKRDERDFRVAHSGFGGTTLGMDRDKVACCEFREVSRREYTTTLPTSVTPGEYALLPPSGQRVFTFRVLE
jgi:hypothetical protein